MLPLAQARDSELRLDAVDQFAHVKMIRLRQQRQPVQLFPIFLRHAVKSFDNFRIELSSGPIV